MTGEFELIRRFFTRPTPQAALGPGDDCALLVPSADVQLAVTTDMLVAGTHFLPETDPWRLGWKTVAVNLSDLAAMGARPRWILLAGSLPEANENWLAAFSDGLFACAAHYQVDLVGGDTTRGALNLCLTAIGEVAAPVALRRDRARAGDDLWLSGQTGLAALGLAHLQQQLELPEALIRPCVDALLQPLARVELGCALSQSGLAHAAIDVSDGLLADLGHVVDASSLAVDLFLGWLPALPCGVDATRARRCQLAGGDDYELLFSASPRQRAAIDALAAQLGVPLTRCGRFVAAREPAVALFDENGQRMTVSERGFDHFA